MATQYSSSIGVTPQGVTINDTRRIYNFGERVAELSPASSPFFSYLSKVAKKPTDDPVFKFLEKRHQWQRRNFRLESAVSAITWSSNDASLNIVDASNMYLTADYDKFGRKGAATDTYAPEFLTVGQIVAIEGIFKNEGAADATSGNGLLSGPVVAYYRISTVNGVGVAGSTIARTEIFADFIKAVYVPGVNTAGGATAINKGIVSFDAADTLEFADDAKGQVVGTAHAEGGTAPDGWRDEFYTNEGYCQIFKTAVPLFSGTALATRYRGDANEYMRVYQEKLMEHKMDIENALLFGYGAAADEVSGSSTVDSDTRKSWGILPYTEINGKVEQFTYASSDYDAFVDSMSNIMDAESGAGGNKLVLASRKIMNWLNKLGSSSFLGNTMAYANAPFSVDVSKGQSMFDGVAVTKVDTLYGSLNFVMEPLLRGPWADHAVAIDLKNVAYRPLQGNGESRDTQIMTNVQNNDVDGRKDMILTEAGLEIALPETHAVLKFK